MKLTDSHLSTIEFERVSTGAPPVPSDNRPGIDVELERGVRLRELPDLPMDLAALSMQAKVTEPDPLIGRYVLADKKNDDRVVASFSLRKKLKPQAQGHMVLTNLNLDAKKLDIYGLLAGLLFLRDWSQEAYGFFSSFSPGHRTTDFECVSEPLPIWSHVSQRTWIPLENGRVQMGGLQDWYFKAPCFSSTDPKALAQLVWKYIEQGRLDEHDILLANYGGWFQCVPVQRKAAKPISFSILNPDEYSVFGGLELCGLIACVRTSAMIKALLQEEPLARRRRLEAAYGEASHYTIGTTPYIDIVD